MAFELLLRSGRDDQISHLRRKEPPQPAHALDFAYLVGDALFELLVEFLHLFCSLAEVAEQTRILSRPLLFRLKQANIFDCYSGLIGEGLHQCNLIIRKGPDFQVINHHHAKQFRSFQNGYAKDSADRLDIFCAIDILRVRSDIGNVDCLSFKRRASGPAVPTGANWVLPHPFCELWSSVIRCSHSQ